MALALFGKKKPGDDNGKAPPSGTTGPTDAASANGAPDSKGPAGSPENAAKFFQHARVAHDATNYEWAMNCWLRGLRQNPTSMPGLEGFFRSAAAFLASGEGKKGVSKDTSSEFGGRGEVERYLAALLNWALKPTDALLAVRAAEAAAEAKVAEPTYWIGERTLNVIAAEKRPRKEYFLRMIKVFGDVGAMDKAVAAGEAAVRLDPSDGPLAAQVRNLAAQATMSRGGYDATGQAGGYRANIRDADKQRMLEAQDRIVKTEETVERLLKHAEGEYKANPDDIPIALRYVDRLRERGTPEDEERAFKILMRGYEKSRQFRLRQMAGEIKLKRARRVVEQYREAAAAAPADEAARQTYEEKRAAVLKMEAEEYKAQMEAYPTDLTIQFELGKRYFDLGQHEDAIPLFQAARDEGKQRVAAKTYLGRAFLQIPGYTNEAIGTFREVLAEQQQGATEETLIDLRYWLLVALQALAEGERDASAAEEAEKLAAAIAIRQFNFRDVRTRREALKKLLLELRPAT